MNKGSDVLAQALGTFMEEAGELLAQMEEILLRAEDGAPFCAYAAGSRMNSFSTSARPSGAGAASA